MKSLKSNKSDDYRNSHSALSKADDYDPQFWTSGTTKHLFWEIERMIISDIINTLTPPPKRALDFACGTGRVLSFLETHVSETTGIDVAEGMLKIARKRCHRSRILEGDLTKNYRLIEDKFDLVSAFRFFLNAQQELRESALKVIHKLITSKGLLIVNFHLNPQSTTGTYLRFRFWLNGTNRSMMTVQEAKSLLWNCGFNPLEVYGYGYLFHRREYVRLICLRGPLEKMLSRVNPWPSIAMNFIIVAQPR